MRLLFFFLKFIISFRNLFSEKSYQVFLINQKAIFIYRSNPEIVVRDYYFYVQGLLLDSLVALNSKCLVFFECPGLKLLKICLPFYEIYLQIEHTLLDPKATKEFKTLPGKLSTGDGSENYLVRIAEFEKLNQASLVIDYSRVNLFNIASSELLKNFRLKSFCISPSLYPIDTKTSGRSGVITLFGNPEIPRRKLFLEALNNAQIEFKNVRGMYFGVEEVYRKAKIIVNVRQTDIFYTLEELRVLPALRSGAIVISEVAPYIKKTAYSKFIIFGTIEELPGLIKEVEQNYQVVHQRIFGDGSENSHFMKRMRRIEKCNVLSMQRAVNYLNSSAR
ncbi:hypothetical protein [Polynucleobacter sp. MWH-Braz-FAM2G]|uniref:hypothetical protein n=1 Tax=Polynucleobacter sp. MWH-Braz-FAM2G TaxID=1855883 RepID=UPI001BFE9ACA|nr:hypothetical protein [Polynucleobacter sp. MWH-Braz-FAM2G]QWD91015.1 hypothetical protein FD973_01360 [Polynucleobacter sp. MWH-Braz-FAM2G]